MFIFGEIVVNVQLLVDLYLVAVIPAVTFSAVAWYSLLKNQSKEEANID
jgi:hypothetical protein